SWSSACTPGRCLGNARSGSAPRPSRCRGRRPRQVPWGSAKASSAPPRCRRRRPECPSRSGGGGRGSSRHRADRLCAEVDRSGSPAGDCWYGNADLTPETAARDITVYREACLRLGREPSRIPIRKDVLICESRSEAEKAGDALVAAGYRGFDRSAVAYGDPAGVAEQLSVYRDLGFTDIMIRTMVPLPGELGPDAAVRSVELAGEVQALLA